MDIRTAILVLTLSTWCQAFAGGGGGCVTGTVIDNKGMPVVGITVRLDSQAPLYLHSNEAVTDKNGNFAITDIVPDNYEVIAYGNDIGYPALIMSFLRPWPPRKVDVEASASCGHITVDVGPRSARLVLKGTDPVTNKPLGTLAVTYGIPSRPRGYSIFLKESRELIVPSQTLLVLDIGVIGYKKTNFTVRGLNPGEVREFQFSLQPIGLGCLAGTLVDDKGAPVEGVKVDMLPLDNSIVESLPMAVSDPQGKFVINDIPPTTYAIFTEKDNGDYVRAWGTIGDEYTPKIDIWPPENAGCQSRVIPIGPRTARLTVYVFDAETGESLHRPSTEFLAVAPAHGGIGIYDGRKPIFVPSLTEYMLTVGAPGYQKAEPVRIQKLAPGESYEIKVFLHRSAKSPAQKE